MALIPAWFGLSLPETIAFYREAIVAGPDLRATRRMLAKQDLFYLLVNVLNRKDMVHPWLLDRCREVQREPDGCLDLWAREHYKSTIITFGLTIQDILNDPEVTFGIFSHTRPVAKGFLRQIKTEFETNGDLKGLFDDVLWADPKSASPKWSEDEGIVVKRRGNPKEATVEAHGLVDGMPTGKHFGKLVYDDVVTRESVTTPEQIKKTTEAFELSDNLGSAGGARRTIGTRYRLGDTYQTMKERGVVKVREYPATHNGQWDGKPVFLAPEELERKKRTQPTTFAAQMLLNPALGPDRIFDPATFKRWEVRPRTLRVFILGDPAKGPGHKEVGRDRDRTAIAVIGVDSARNKYLLDGYRHRMTLGERWERLRDLYFKWRGTRGVSDVSVHYERYGLQTDNEYFERMMEIERRVFAIEEVNWPREGSGSKEDRITRLVPDLADGSFLLPAVVWHESHGKALWRVEGGEFVFEKMNGPTPLQRRAQDDGSPDLVCEPIKRLDENRAVYDLTRDCLEEVSFFPFGTHEDLIDAMSRIYDADPTPPMPGQREQIEVREYVDGV
jgi:hypothetical protein